MESSVAVSAVMLLLRRGKDPKDTSMELWLLPVQCFADGSSWLGESSCLVEGCVVIVALIVMKSESIALVASASNAVLLCHYFTSIFCVFFLCFFGKMPSNHSSSSRSSSFVCSFLCHRIIIIIYNAVASLQTHLFLLHPWQQSGVSRVVLSLSPGCRRR